jgi:rubredoxin
LRGSIIIKKETEVLFSISHTRDFNPNSKDEVLYAEHLERADLAENLIKLCNGFYKSQSEAIEPTELPNDAIQQEKTIVYECSCCLSRYDMQYGDLANNVAPGTEFESIDSYNCPVCDAPKNEFRSVSVSQNI